MVEITKEHLKFIFKTVENYLNGIKSTKYP